MENLNLQKGDVVRIKELIVDQAAAPNDSIFAASFEGSSEVWFIPMEGIEEVVSRSETPEQMASRLSGELSVALRTLEAKSAELEDYRTRKEATIRQLFAANQELTFRAQALEASLAKLEAFHAQAPAAAPKEEAPEAPWYPPQQEGYGPWIEGPPPLDWKGPFQIVSESERNKDFHYSNAICWCPEDWQTAVAHCFPLEEE